MANNELQYTVVLLLMQRKYNYTATGFYRLVNDRMWCGKHSQGVKISHFK